MFHTDENEWCCAGGGPTSMFQTFGQIRSDVEEMNNKIGQMQEKIDTSAIVEKKVLLVLESLTNKVDSIVSRENDFKYLRNSLSQDWIK